MTSDHLSVMCHELGNPLTAIGGALQVLGNTIGSEPTPQAQRMLGVCERALDRLAAMLGEIRELTQLESGRVPMVLAPNETFDMWRRVAARSSDRASQVGVRLLPGACPGVWRGDSARVEQALCPLVERAIEASPPGSSICLTSHCTDLEFQFMVADQGDRLEQGQLATLFEPYQATLAHGRGTRGLGLAICRAIALQHGGRVWAEERPDGGSVLGLALPAGTRR